METCDVVSDWVPWCINTGKSLIPLTLLFLHQKRNLLIPLELSRVMHQGTESPRGFPDSDPSMGEVGVAEVIGVTGSPTRAH